jgi:large subunit ribosomal protein L21
MYAVIRTGGKQYRVKPGDVLEIEHLSDKGPHRSSDGSSVSFTPILVSTDDGRTLHGREAGGFAVGATMLGDAKGDKVIVFKYKNKTGYANRTGHRQLYSLIEITTISESGARPEPAAEPEAAPEAEAAPETEPAAEPAAEPEAAEPVAGEA